jgi:hypothetical protein
MHGIPRSSKDAAAILIERLPNRRKAGDQEG